MTEKIYYSFYCTLNTRKSVKEQNLLVHLHFEEKKCGEGSKDVRKASLGGGFWGLGKETIWLERTRNVLEAVANEILRGERNREKALGISR
jgi:hypothetical protein